MFSPLEMLATGMFMLPFVFIIACVLVPWAFLSDKRSKD